MSVRVGVGGWTFAPWRGLFYPKGLPQGEELAFASRRLTSIEINATFYGRQPEARFAAWEKATPDGFVFTVKGSRFCTWRRDLREAGEGIEGFLAQGLAALGPKLGAVMWQLAPTKVFDAEEIEGFLRLLPHRLEGAPLRHAVEARHESFKDARFIDLMRARGVATVLADSPDHPLIADPTGPIAYLRLMRAQEALAEGYAEGVLKEWARRARALEGGRPPPGLELACAPAPGPPREVFVFFIEGAKRRAPAAAQALLRLLGDPAPP